MPASRRPALLDLARSRVDALSGVVASRVLGQPESRLRRLAGRPLVIDGNELAVDAQMLLRLQGMAGEKGPEEFETVEEGRANLLRQSRVATRALPIGQVHERTVRGAGGPLPARLFVPRGVVAPGPLTLYFHGGGMAYGSVEIFDGVCRVLAEESGVRVLSVDYRLAPEHPFPAGVDDAWAAFEWVTSNAADYDAEPGRIAVSGDSAGGYLSAATAIRAAQEKVPLAFQLLLYPVCDFAGDLPSRSTFADGFMFSRRWIEGSGAMYVGDADPRDPRISVANADLPPSLVQHLAPAHVVTAGFDVLRDEGIAYVRKLEEAGATVTHQHEASQLHAFANQLAAAGTGEAGLRRAARALRSGLAT